MLSKRQVARASDPSRCSFAVFENDFALAQACLRTLFCQDRIVVPGLILLVLDFLNSHRVNVEFG